MKVFWNIDITDRYFEQVSQIPIREHANIERFINELSTHENPTVVGSSTVCPKDDFVLAIYPGLLYEFIYHIDKQEKTITLISCEKLTFLDHGQEVTI